MIVVIIAHLFFNWSAIALQCCVGFSCTIKWISHVYVYKYISRSSRTSFPSTPIPTPPGHHRALSWAPAELLLSFPPAIYFTHSSVYRIFVYYCMGDSGFQIKFSIQTGLWIPKSWELLTQWLHCIWTCLWGPPGDVAPAVSQDDSFRSKVLWSHDTENVLFAPGASRVQWLRSMNPVTRQNWI